MIRFKFSIIIIINLCIVFAQDKESDNFSSQQTYNNEDPTPTSMNSVIDDSLSKIHNNIKNMIAEYHSLVDLKRNLSISRLKDENTSTFIYLLLNNYPIIYDILNNYPEMKYKINPLMHTPLYKIYPYRITFLDGSQWIKTIHIDGYRGFLRYNDVKNELPSSFRSFIEDPYLDIYDNIKFININETDSENIDRWIQLTSEVEDKKIIKHTLKNTNYEKMSKIFDLLNVLTFTLVVYSQID